MQSWFRYDGERTLLATYDRSRPLEDFPLEQRIRAANVWKPREFFVTILIAATVAYFLIRASFKVPFDTRLLTVVELVLAFVFARGGFSIALSIVEWVYGPTFASLHVEPLVKSDDTGDAYVPPVRPKNAAAVVRRLRRR